MGLYIDQGNFSFEQAMNDVIYVDKSALLGHLNRMVNTRRKFVCVTRPRRFGKSLAAQMLCAYYDRSCDSRSLFEGLSIARDETFERYLNKFPVISLDVHEERSRINNGMDFVPWLQERVLSEIRELWGDIIQPGDTLPLALARINDKTGTQFVICLDEWHSIYRMDAGNEKAQEAWIEFLRAMFKGLGADRYIALAYMTGVLPIRNYASESPLSNFYEYNIFDTSPLETCYGFTLEEGELLCQQYDMNFSEMKRWYDGYCFEVNQLENGKRVFRKIPILNPNSVIRSILSGKFQCYWNDTGSLEPVIDYIKLDVCGLRQAIVLLVSGQPCAYRQIFFGQAFNNTTSFDSVMTMLTHLGYLTYDTSTGMGRIPNEEIREAMYLAAEDRHWDEVRRSVDESLRFVDYLVNGYEEGVVDILDRIHRELASILTFNNENTLACVVMYACYTARKDFFVFRELPSGVGFVDIALIPLPNRGLPAILVELKWNKDAETAMKQIYDRKYPSAFERYDGEIVLAAVNYDKDSKDKMHTCKIERVVKG
ncbi:MAG: AAA family ATPase [Proteobacteria bacterium]|nr:AAA family ATPase [Pseudomonadota bacterium]